MKPFQVPATFTSLRYLSDGGVSLGFHTQELTNEEKLMIGAYHNQFGRLLFRSNDEQYTDEEIVQEDVSFDGKKPSQRLRAVLYRFWEYKGKQGDFEIFYRAKVEEMIDHYKAKLPHN